MTSSPCHDDHSRLAASSLARISLQRHSSRQYIAQLRQDFWAPSPALRWYCREANPLLDIALKPTVDDCSTRNTTDLCHPFHPDRREPAAIFSVCFLLTPRRITVDAACTSSFGFHSEQPTNIPVLVASHRVTAPRVV